MERGICVGQETTSGAGAASREAPSLALPRFAGEGEKVPYSTFEVSSGTVKAPDLIASNFA